MQCPNLINILILPLGGKFLETEGSNFCREGSCTNTSPAYAATPVKRKRHLGTFTVNFQFVLLGCRPFIAIISNRLLAKLNHIFLPYN